MLGEMEAAPPPILVTDIAPPIKEELVPLVGVLLYGAVDPPPPTVTA
jgi:hypothetical protein